MSNEAIRRDMVYHAALCIAKSMLAKEIITEDEYRKIDELLLEIYCPYLGKLLSENA